MTAIPMELSVKLSDVTESGKSKMAAFKLRLRVSQLVYTDSNKIPTAIAVFLVSNNQIRIVIMFYKFTNFCNPTELLGIICHQNGSGKSKMAAIKLEVLIS